MNPLDDFKLHIERLDSPGVSAIEITPSNSTPLVKVSRAIYIGGSGDLVVEMLGGQTPITFVGVSAGCVLPIRVTKVLESTSATNLVALY
ncbi:tail fiber protein [Flavobacterium phage vB_FspM_immuto_3-5A]|uniref:Tail fiber protein n=1 Tax=Flavobacterium phage vB_FspM_immuto_2-6A TaxID=2801477 RepID=A0A7T8ERP6_9CAUD|nr:tail fiber protein [Flavobacterium phage vB_FspM_immuto_2-6A]QQO91885.1 tail fiber protein [Flavobacterium phage vB_FspM_immuto_2-6A]QQO92123.1 tail fiber protein [Flavobacterium phage vB_FspM_immuto_3-5A]QQO92361.1 tail fiber protein [Flavobacterium phage vB_FspM_immuto_13-6C]